MTEAKATPREMLEFNISNKPNLLGTFNGKPISIGRIKLTEITDTWSEIVAIMQTYQTQVTSIRSSAGGDSDEQVATAESLFDILDKMGPGVVKILHEFIKATTNMTDEQLADADFWALTELVVIIMEHNVGDELVGFFGRGADVLRTLRLMPESADTKQNNSSSKEVGQQPTSENSTPAN